MRRLAQQTGVLAAGSAGAVLGACVLTGLVVALDEQLALAPFNYSPWTSRPGHPLAPLVGAAAGALVALVIAMLPIRLGARRTAVCELGVFLSRAAGRRSTAARAAHESTAAALLGGALASPALLALLGLGESELDALRAALPATPLTVIEPALAWSLGALGACLLAGLAIRVQLRLRPRRGRRLTAGALAVPLASALLGLLVLLPSSS